MSTYAKYADMYKNRTRSSDTRGVQSSQIASSPLRGGITDPKNTSMTTATKEPQNLKMMTDRNSYMTFLEVQLERVSQACLTVSGFSEKMEQMQT
jgi:hypothetical protein